MNYNPSKQKKEEIDNIVRQVKNLAPEVVKDFVTYWSIRKSPPFVADDIIHQMTLSESSLWLNLIESNHKFRDTYGDKKAQELINIIEDGKLTQESIVSISSN